MVALRVDAMVALLVVSSAATLVEQKVSCSVARWVDSWAVKSVAELDRRSAERWAARTGVHLAAESAAS